MSNVQSLKGGKYNRPEQRPISIKLRDERKLRDAFSRRAASLWALCGV